MPAPSPFPVVTLAGVPVHCASAAQAIDHVMRELGDGRGGWVLTPNLDILRRLATDREFAAVCDTATLRVADGSPLVWASRLQRTPLPERVAGSDLIWSLTARAAAEGRSVFFLGGNPGAADAAASRLAAMHPALRIAGTECPPFGFESDAPYMERLAAKLAATAPDICYVALSSPRQDRLIRRLMPVLSHTWFLGIGISFSFVSGEVKRAPRWLQRIGLEWLHRLIQEPGRLARRYLVDGLPFAFMLLSCSALQGVRRGAQRPKTPAPAPPRPPDAAPAAPADPSGITGR